MKIEIELGFSHIRDSIQTIDAQLAKMEPGDQARISITHLRNALMQALPVGLQRLVQS